MATNYLTVLERVVEKTLDQIPGTPQSTEYTVFPTTLIVADAQGNPQPTLIYILNISIPSLSIGEVLTGPATIPSSRPSEEQIADATRMLLESLIQERTRLGQEAMQQADQTLLSHRHRP